MMSRSQLINVMWMQQRSRSSNNLCGRAVSVTSVQTAVPALHPYPLITFDQMSELTHDELDLVVMGQVMAGCFSAETFRKQERSKSFAVFHHSGTRICQKTFLFLHAMGYSHFKAIKANGVVTRVHGNKGKSHKKDKLTFQQIEDVVQYILNYAGMCRPVKRSVNEWEWVCVCMTV